MGKQIVPPALGLPPRVLSPGTQERVRDSRRGFGAQAPGLLGPKTYLVAFDSAAEHSRGPVGILLGFVVA